MPIRKVKTGYKIDRVRGISKTLSAAKKRLKAVKASQTKRRKKKK